MNAPSGPARRTTSRARFVFTALVIIVVLTVGWSLRGTDPDPAEPERSRPVSAEEPRIDLPAGEAAVEPPASGPEPESGDPSGRAEKPVIARGRVVDGGGRPVPGARVYLVDQYDPVRAGPEEGRLEGRNLLRTTTDADGRYEFRFGYRSLIATHSLLAFSDAGVGLLAELAPGHRAFGPPPDPDLPDLVVQPGVRVRCEVVDSWGEPVVTGKVKLVVSGLDGALYAIQILCALDASGGVSFPPLPVRSDWRLTVHVSAEGRVPREEPLHTPSILRGEPFRVALKDGMVVRGSFVDETGEPIVGTPFRLVSKIGHVEREMSTGPDGRFEIHGVTPTGSNLVYAYGSTGDPRNRPSQSVPQVIPIPDGVHGREVDLGPIRLGRPVPFSGLVVDGNGAPLAGAGVGLETSIRGVGAARVLSGSSGRFRFHAVPPGTYTVVAAKHFEGFGTRKGRVEGVSTADARLVVTIRPGGAVVLRFHDAASPDTPLSVSRYRVSFKQDSGSFGGGGGRSSGGITFARRNLKPGVYEVTVRVPGYRPADLGRVTVTDDEDTVVDVLLTVE